MPQARGHRIASVTMSFGGHARNGPDGRDIPYAPLMHAGGVRMMRLLLALYRENDVEFVTLREAERDPFHAADNKTRATIVPTSLEEAMRPRACRFRR